jgi:hypothetical protein
MKKLILLSSILLFACAFSFAQTDSDASSASTSNMTPVQGCLSSMQGNYVLTDSSGNNFVLLGKTDDLHSSVGHEVQVMGTEMHVEAQSKTGTADNPSMSHPRQNESMRSFNVRSFKDVASTCSTGGAAQH